MKKIILFSAVLWVVVFVMSMVLSKQNEEIGRNSVTDTDEMLEVVSVNDEEDGTSKSLSDKSFDEKYVVKIKQGDGVTKLPLHTYLVGVVAAEMPASFPLEALKAQAVAARTFVLRRGAEARSNNQKEGHDDAIVCDDSSCCMAYLDLETKASTTFGANEEEYKQKIIDAVVSTDGQYLTYENVPILAAFHAVSGGRTENAGDVWQSEVPYLVSVESLGEENSAQYQNDVTYTAKDVKNRILESYPKAVFPDDIGTWFQNAIRGDGGVIKSVTVGGIKIRGGALRSILQLNSADFTISVGKNDSGEETLTFHTVGYGHGVGMSQYGAFAMAQQGHTYKEILHHYYTDVTLLNMADS